MATTKAIEENAIKNNGATVLYGGNVPSNATRVTNVIGMTAVGYHSGKHGSVVPNDVDSGIYPVNNAANFAKMVPGKYIAMKQTTELAGSATNVLLFGDNAGGHRSIHKIEEMRTSKLSAWSVATTSEGGARTTYTYSNLNLGFNEDNAARPTRAVPGELTYQKGSNTPVNDDYKPRTG